MLGTPLAIFVALAIVRGPVDPHGASRADGAIAKLAHTLEGLEVGAAVRGEPPVPGLLRCGVRNHLEHQGEVKVRQHRLDSSDEGGKERVRCKESRRSSHDQNFPSAS